MFYLSNVDAWLEEVLDRCSENSLDPQASIFAIFLFSSLDIEYVDFFARHKAQISAASGTSVHLFTPVVHHDQTIPDDEWRRLRGHFRNGGIPLPGTPSVVLFNLIKRRSATGFEPNYIAAYGLSQKRDLPELMRDFVDACIDNRGSSPRLCREVGGILRSKNLITTQPPHKNLFVEPHWNDILHSPQVFISYAHSDSEVVNTLYQELKRSRIHLWLDRCELSPGIRIQDGVEAAINDSDALMVILSEASAKSAWIQFEGTLFYGRDAKRRIIPVVIDDAGRQMVDSLPFLRDRVFVDLRDRSRFEEAIEVLRDSLHSL